ncbi:MAG: peptidoglycan-associated lipoprotein Pal [Burkholderiales bacterium]|nr:peptidoglycan-associated lipoprotein Pal [Burkholderiales bacterium]
MRRILLSALLVSLLAACASKDVKDEGAPVEDRKPAAVTAPPPPATTTPPQKTTPPVVKQIETRPAVANPLKDPGNILSKRSVFFDFDSTAVKDEFKPVVSAHAKFLTDNRGRRMVIQGNTDERGSREYNLALGQRRADSVKKMMMLLGATDAQIETVSFGEEKPRSAGGDESAWSQNRRADIVYDGE